jgi:hypothetical protein
MRMRPVARGPPGRSKWRRMAGLDPPLDGAYRLTREYSSLGKAAPNSSIMPGPASSPGTSNSEGDVARVRWQDLRTLTSFWISSIDLRSPCPGTGR